MTSFGNLAFPLFAGPLSHAADVLGPARCSLCGRDAFCLELSIGHDVIGPCASCGAMTDHSADGGTERCISCDAPSGFRKSAEGRPACVACLRAGRFAITKDTDLGMVRWRDAVAGSTHGLPRESGGWEKVPVASDVLLNLVLTPDFASLQGGVWKFHCERPMAFVGRWGTDDFDRHASDGDGAALAEAIADLTDAYSDLGPDADDDSLVWTYMFRCLACDALAGSWDYD